MPQDWLELGKGKPLNTMPPPTGAPVHVLTGLGSRGLTTAPMMAEVLACQLCHEPLPLPGHLLNTINPWRFTVRQAIRGELSTPLPSQD